MAVRRRAGGLERCPTQESHSNALSAGYDTTAEADRPKGKVSPDSAAQDWSLGARGRGFKSRLSDQPDLSCAIDLAPGRASLLLSGRPPSLNSESAVRSASADRRLFPPPAQAECDRRVCRGGRGAR